MKNNESKWIKSASGWQLKTAFSGDPSMTELATPSFEEREPHGLSSASGEAEMEHSDHINSLLAELRNITDKANDITRKLEENGLNHEDIVAFIMRSNKE